MTHSNNHKNSLHSKALEFSFGFGGWLQFYLLGVANCLIEHNLHDNCTVVGCSAGSLAAMSMILGGSFEAVLAKCKEELIPECRKDLGGLFKLSEYVSRCLDYATDLSQFSKANNKLIIQTTSTPSFKPVRVSQFTSEEDLKTALLASCAVVPFSPLIRRKDGKLYADGGLTDCQPILSDKTVTINPFHYWKADIKPSQYVPIHWAILPPTDASAIDWLFDLGYKDTLRWVLKNGFSCSHGEGKETYCSKRQCCQSPGDDHDKNRFQKYFAYGAKSLMLDFIIFVGMTILWKPFAYTLIWTDLFLLKPINMSRAALKELIPN